MNPDTGGMERIGNIIGKVLDSKNDGQQQERDVRPRDWESLWNSVAGDHVRAHTYVRGVTGPVMTVRVDGSAYLAELRMQRERFAQALRTASGGTIHDVRFRI